VGVYNKIPSAPKYSGFWDVDTVINFLIALGPNSDLPFNSLSRKLATLLALASLCRVSELANIDRNSIVLDNNQARFTLSKPRKSQRNSSLQVFSLEKLSPPLLASQVEALKDLER